MKEDWMEGGRDRIMAAERSMGSVWDVNADEASLGTRCSSRTGECSNNVDTAFFSAPHPSSGVPL